MRQVDLFARPSSAVAGGARSASSEPSERPPDARGRAPVPNLPAERVLTVSELTGAIKALLEPRFARVLVRGEISSFRGVNARGHLFFSLKDAGASLPVVLWAGQAKALRFRLQEGLAVVIEGALSVYEPHGNYRLVGQRVIPEGVGALALAFEQLKEKLAAEGLIGASRTKPFRRPPLLPRRIGVVTSVSGAALRDFLKVLHRRNPRLSVLVCDARVQGDGAAADLCRGLAWLGRTDVEVIVLTRGGGSAEDLWAFNEERLARAIFASAVPVVSAVGHEIDTTLSDLVADVRAPTPSAAAELLAPDLAELTVGLSNTRLRLRKAVEAALRVSRRELQVSRAGLGDPRLSLSRSRFILSDVAERLERPLRAQLGSSRGRLDALDNRLQRARPQGQLRARGEALRGFAARLSVAVAARLRLERRQNAQLTIGLERASPVQRLGSERVHLRVVRGRLESSARGHVHLARERFAALGQTLDALSPLAVLGRGYAIVQRLDGRVVRRAAQVSPGEPLQVRLGFGEMLEAVVTGARSP